MVTGDASYIKKINRSLIIKKIIEEGMISRADLSKATDLTRATISAQAVSLLEEGLIVERQLEHYAVGRKPIMLSINGEAGYSLGIDLDYGHISFTLSNLLGHPISTKDIEISTTEYTSIFRILINEIKSFITNFSDSLYGIIGIVIGIHGLVTKDEVIQYVPSLQWRDIPLKRDLQKEIDINIYLENNANLCSFAERVFVHHETDNLLCASLSSGIGLGMMMNSEFFRGHDGFAGEIGHMIVVPGGKPCKCGNLGCWEQYASETSFFKQLSEERHIKNLSYDQIQRWIDEGDEIVLERIEEFIYYLSIGLNNMINLYNPDVLVLYSELLRMLPESINKIKENLTSSISHYRELSISSIGKKACAMGACALAIKHFLDVPMLNLTYEEDAMLKSKVII